MVQIAIIVDLLLSCIFLIFVTLSKWWQILNENFQRNWSVTGQYIILFWCFPLICIIYMIYKGLFRTHTVQKIKFSIKNFFRKCYQIRSFLRIWSHLLRKAVPENFIFLCSASQADHMELLPKIVNAFQQLKNQIGLF